MIVLGIDQAEKGATGFAIIDLSLSAPQNLLYTYLETYEYLNEFGKVKKIPMRDARTRCLRFAATLAKILKEYKPDVVCTEIVRAYHQNITNTNTIAALSEIQGVMFVVVRQKDKPVPIYRFNTSSWQSVMLSPKKHDDRKALSVKYAQALYHQEFSEHVADAIFIALAYPILKDNPNENITERY